MSKVSRTSAWAKRAGRRRPRATRPAACAGSSQVEHVVLGRCPRPRPASGGRTRARGPPRPGARRRLSSAAAPAAGRARPAPPAAGSSASSRPTSLRSPASRAYSTRKNGLPSVRSRSAVGLVVGRLGCGDRRRTPRAASAAASPASSRRTACRRASASATSASAPAGSGWPRQVATPAAGRGHGLGEQPQHPQRRRRRPSAGRRGRQDRAGRAAAARTVADDRSQVRNCGARRRRRPGAPAARRPARASTAATATAAGRRRPASSGRPAPGAAACGHRRELGAEPGLADARLAGEHGERRRPRSACVERADQRGELLVPADQRPAPSAARRRRPWRAVGSARRRRGASAPGRSRPGQVGVLAQHARSQVAQLRRRVQAELVGRAPRGARAGRPSASAWRPAGQRERPQRPEPLAQRVLRWSASPASAAAARVPTERELGRRSGPRARPAGAPPAGRARRPRPGRRPARRTACPATAPAPRRARRRRRSSSAPESAGGPSRGTRATAAGTAPRSASKARGVDPRRRGRPSA